MTGLVGLCKENTNSHVAGKFSMQEASLKHQSQSFVDVQLKSRIISILQTAQGVTSVKLNSSIQGFYELDIRQTRKLSARQQSLHSDYQLFPCSGRLRDLRGDGTDIKTNLFL